MVVKMKKATFEASGKSQGPEPMSRGFNKQNLLACHAHLFKEAK